MKKSFADMTQAEIDAMSKEDFDNVSPFEKKACHNCAHLLSAMSLYCGSAEARKARGTSIPGCIKCPYWKPSWRNIPKKYHTEENKYSKETADEGEQTFSFTIHKKRWWQFWKS